MSTELQSEMPFWAGRKVGSPNWVACEDQHGVAFMSAWVERLECQSGFSLLV
jgi:hypothetical protein